MGIDKNLLQEHVSGITKLHVLRMAYGVFAEPSSHIIIVMVPVLHIKIRLFSPDFAYLYTK